MDSRVLPESLSEEPLASQSTQQLDVLLCLAEFLKAKEVVWPRGELSIILKAKTEIPSWWEVTFHSSVMERTQAKELVFPLVNWVSLGKACTSSLFPHL